MLTTSEGELRAALAVEGAEERERRTAAELGGLDHETRERVELRGRARCGKFLLAALQGRQLTGAELEYRTACGILEAGHIPFDLGLPVPHNFSLDFMEPLRYCGQRGGSESGRAQPAG